MDSKCKYCKDFPALPGTAFCHPDCEWAEAHASLSIADQQDHAINGCDCKEQA